MGLTEVQRLVTIRDSAAVGEQQIEDEIFDLTSRSLLSREILLRKYLRCKRRRERAAIKAARAYMQLSKADKKAFISWWMATSEGKRKVRGSGVRGAALVTK